MNHVLIVYLYYIIRGNGMCAEVCYSGTLRSIIDYIRSRTREKNNKQERTYEVRASYVCVRRGQWYRTGTLPHSPPPKGGAEPTRRRANRANRIVDESN